MEEGKNMKIIIVGAGPGGLTAGMILAHRGYEVEIFEKENRIGGRNAAITQDGFTFDIGPTFLMLKPVLEEVFQLAEENITDYLKFYELDPMYRLVFKNKTLNISANHAKTRTEIQQNFPGEGVGFDRLLKREEARFKVAYACLKKDYSSFYKLFNWNLFKFLPKLSFPRSMHDELGVYFTDEDLKMAFTFQSKYLGMSPWQCPAAYMIIPYIEHHYGIQHVEGGLSQISSAMGRVIEKKGGRITLNTKVIEAGSGFVVLENGEKIMADEVIVNADAGYALKEILKKKDLSKKDFSCSTFMLYLGIEGELDWAHHTVWFSDDYEKFVQSIFSGNKLTDDFSMYIRNASVVDKKIAPEGKSNIYVLIPVPNNKSKIDWESIKSEYRDKVLEKIKDKTGVDLKSRIITEHIIMPTDWEKQYNVFLGATFNLSHKLNQMLYFRPHNKLEDGLYLVGGGTHPGSGLPTIYESGRIAADMISKK
jgi:phytoene desaturase